jgi:hypothetical protein
LDQTGESRARPREAQSDVPGEAPPRKPGFHPKQFAGGKKKPGKGGYKGKHPRPPQG